MVKRTAGRLARAGDRTTLTPVRASVVSAGGERLGALLDVLGELGVGNIWVLSNSVGDRYFFDPFPDMAIGVLNPESAECAGDPPEGLSNLDVMLRIGRAAERGVPAIVIVPPPLAMPAPADGVAFAPCPVGHQSALWTHLWAFTATLRSHQDSPPLKADRERTPVDSAGILSEFERSKNISAPRFGEIVSSVLRQAGAASVGPERYEADRGVDIVFAPSPDSSSVILVEARTGQLDELRLREAEQRLQNYVIERHAGLGLVIYHDSHGRQFPSRRPTPLIARLSIEELVGKLETRSLTQVISDATVRR